MEISVRSDKGVLPSARRPGSPPSHEPKKTVGSKERPVFFVRAGYFILSLVLGVILLELGSRVVLRLYEHFHKPAATGLDFDSPVYVDSSWLRQCWKEQPVRLKSRNVYFPFRIWGITEWHGKCTNNDVTTLGAVRRTIDSPSLACARLKAAEVWVLGGSAVYGTLVPDWATLPSYLSKELNTPPQCARIFNLGVEGYRTNQDLLLLIEKLKAGKVPDVVILFDGFNDSDIGTLNPGPATHLGFQTIKARVEGTASSRLDFLQRSGMWQLALELGKGLGRKGPTRVSPEEMPTRVAATMDNYENNVSIMRMLGRAYGFKVCAFWQPAVVYGHKPLTDYERRLLELSYGKAYPFQALVPVYREADNRARPNGDFVFLGGAFDAVTEEVYLDWVHLNPRGNELIAHDIAKRLPACMQ